jgi:hypothetical protein
VMRVRVCACVCVCVCGTRTIRSLACMRSARGSSRPARETSWGWPLRLVSGTSLPLKVRATHTHAHAYARTLQAWPRSTDRSLLSWLTSSRALPGPHCA